METSGYVPAIRVDLSDLADLVVRPGPAATVYLTTDPAVENASSHSQLRWRAVREDLAAQGTPEKVLDTVADLVPDAHRWGGCLTVVAGSDGVRLVESHPEPPVRDLGRWAELCSVGAVIEWRQMEPPHLLVLVDRQGADLIAYRARQPDVVREVKGDTYPIHGAAVGGWAQRHHQAKVQENWEQNASLVAQQVVDLAKSIDSQVIAVAGDVRARELLLEALPAELAAEVVQVDGGRAPDGSEDRIAEEVVTAAAAAAARVTREALAKFKEEKGQGERAADGASATIEALARSQVAVLLLHDDPEDTRMAWFGPEPGHIATSRDDLEGMGVREPKQGRLADVAIRAALGTGADVRVVPAHGGPSDGVGALLRWS